MSSNLVQRNYKICWRFNIGIDDSNRDLGKESKYRFLSYYMPRWSELMKTVMKRNLSVEQIKRIPELRNICKNQEIIVERIFALVSKKDLLLSKKLTNAAPLYDASPMDLKLYILSVFNITPDELSEYLSSN